MYRYVTSVGGGIGISQMDDYMQYNLDDAHSIPVVSLLSWTAPPPSSALCLSDCPMCSASLIAPNIEQKMTYKYNALLQ